MGSTREFKKGNCIERQRFLYPKERKIGEIHCFILFHRPIRYTRRRRNGEERKKKREREREIGEIHCFIPFRSLVRLVRQTRNGDRQKLEKNIVSLFSVCSVRCIRRRTYGERVCVLEILRTVHIREE